MVTPEEAHRNIVLNTIYRPRNGWSLLSPRRQEVEAIRDEDLERIRSIDAAAARLIRERRDLARRVVRANSALGYQAAHGAYPAHWPPLTPPPRPFEGSRAPPPTTIEGRPLRDEVVRILRHAADDTLSAREIVDVLALQGFRPAGANPSQAVWNALRSATTRGEVWKPARGRYQAVPMAPSIGCVSDESPVNLSRQGPPETVLPPDPPEAVAALHEAMKAPDAIRRDAVSDVVRGWPTYLEAWARLGELGRDAVESYACFRVGYHRGLDRLRQSGWRGSGYVRWEHETNQGFLLALQGLQRAAADIGEDAEAERCAQFLAQLDPSLG